MTDRYLKVQMGLERPGDVMAAFREAETSGEFGSTDCVAYTERAGEPIVPYVSEHMWNWLQRRFGRSIVSVGTVDALPDDVKWVHRPRV
jgi:hypothetical protein